MHRIDSQNAVDGTFVPGNPAAGTPPTFFSAAWCNAQQEEIAHVIEQAGIELDKDKNTQLMAAIQHHIQQHGGGAGGTPGADGEDGQDGADGASAYDLWLAAGNTGTLADFLASLLAPTGAILPFAGATPPSGYLLANGAELSRTSYADLFGVIGETWGAGDGSTTFTLPDLRGRFLRCAGDVNPPGQYQDGSLMFSQSLWGWHPSGNSQVGSTANVWSQTDRNSFFENHDDIQYINNTNSGDNVPYLNSGIAVNSTPHLYTGRVRPDNAAVNFMIKY